MKIFVLLVISALFIVVSMPIATGDSEKVELPKYSTTVKLAIQAEDEIKNEVYSYLSREVRSLGDVKLVEDNPNWIIQVVAIQVKNKLGYKTGVAFSIVIDKRPILVVPLLLQLFKYASGISPQELKEAKVIDLEKAFTKVTDGLSDIRDHSLRVGSTEDIQRICQMIVADFDAEHVKKNREMWQKSWDELLRYIQKYRSTKEKDSQFDVNDLNKALEAYPKEGSAKENDKEPKN